MYNFDTNTIVNACKIFENENNTKWKKLAKVLQIRPISIDSISLTVYRNRFKYFPKVGMQYTNLRK